jgi:hypothetical protein
MEYAQAQKFLTLFAPALVTAGATATSRIDLLGCDSATIWVNVVQGNTATIASGDGLTISVKASDDTNVSTFATVAANKTAIKTTENAYYTINAKNVGKRYLLVSVIPGTTGVTNEQATVAINGALNKLEQSPANTSQMLVGTSVTLPASNTNDVVTVVV